jgi:hypothetical protein
MGVITGDLMLFAGAVAGTVRDEAQARPPSGGARDDYRADCDRFLRCVGQLNRLAHLARQMPGVGARRPAGAAGPGSGGGPA